MADSILRLRVESSEYDEKLKKAAEGIRHLAEVAHRSGGDLTGLEKAELDYIRALGDMQTVSRSASGQLRELTNTYRELTVVYNNLNDVEKADEGGRALAASLDRLRERAQQAKSSLDAANASLNATGQESSQTGGFMDQLASRLTVNIDAAKVFSMGLQAVQGALRVAGEAIMQSESNIDEWDRTVQGAQGAYDYFLQALNTGNWSNFFTNLSTAVQGARDLCDALDRLGSIKSNNQAAIAIVQQQIAQLRLAKQQGQEVDEQLKAATAQLARLQKQSIDAGKVAGTKTITETLRNRIDANNTTGVNISEGSLKGVAGRLTTYGQDAFDQYNRQYEQLQAKGLEEVTKYDSLTKSYYQARVFNLEKLTKTEQERYLIAEAVTQGETRIQKGISMYAQAVQEGTSSAREEFKGNRYALQGATGGGGNTTQKTPEVFAPDSIRAQEKIVEELTKKWKTAGESVKADYKKQLDEAKKKLEQMQAPTLISGSLPALTKELQELQKAQSQAANGEEYRKLGVQIEDVTRKIAVLKGELPKDEEATISVNVNEDALTDLQEALDEMDQSKVTVNVEQNGDLDALKDKTVTVSVVTKDSESLKQIQGLLDQQGLGFTLKIGKVTIDKKAFNEVNLNELISRLKKQAGEAEIGSDLWKNLRTQLADANALSNLIQEAIKNGIDITQFDPHDLWKHILGGEDVADEEMQKRLDIINKARKEKGLDPLSMDFTTGNMSSGEDKDSSKDLQKKYDKMIGGLSQVSGGLQNMGVKLPDGVLKLLGAMQGISQVIEGVKTVISVFSSSSQTANTAALGVNTGAIGALTAAMAQNTAAEAVPLSTGGMNLNGKIIHAAVGTVVPGNYGYDAVPAMLTSGEVVLNHAQVGNLASQLNDNREQPRSTQPYVTGDKIYLGMKNFLQGAGMGDIVLSK